MGDENGSALDQLVLEDIAIDEHGTAYISGRFCGTLLSPGNGQLTDPIDPIQTETDGTCNDLDVFVLQLTHDEFGATGGWLTGGVVDYAQAVDGVPDRASGRRYESGRAVAISGASVYVGGSFTANAIFGQNYSNRIDSEGSHDGFITQLSANGQWYQDYVWTVGVPVRHPPDAKVDDLVFAPEIFVNGVHRELALTADRLFDWSCPNAACQLIPLQSLDQVQIAWRRQDEELASVVRAIQTGRVDWPVDSCGSVGIGTNQGCYQRHVAGAPVEVEPAGTHYPGQPSEHDTTLTVGRLVQQ